MLNPFKIVSIAVALSTLWACSESKGAKSGGETRQTGGNQAADSDPSSPVSAESKPDLPPLVVGKDSENTIVKGACKQKLPYDETKIECTLNEASQTTIWQTVPGWEINLLRDRYSNWISPVKAVVENGVAFCPAIPDSDKAIYVSSFKLDEDADVYIEARIDNVGQVRLWKNADSNQEVFLSAKSDKVGESVSLKKGFYTAVIDGIDLGGASGIRAAIMKRGDYHFGLLRSGTQNWCIFRVTSETDVAAFLNSAASCKSCMIGYEAAAEFSKP